MDTSPGPAARPTGLSWIPTSTSRRRRTGSIPNLLGRRTFEATGGRDTWSPGLQTFVFSRTLRQSDYKHITVLGDNWKEVVRSLRDEAGKDIWLFGGGSLFRSLAAERFVDTVEVAVMPTILGGGIPLVAEPASRIALTLTEQTTYEKSGIVSLVYAVNDVRRK